MVRNGQNGLFKRNYNLLQRNQPSSLASVISDLKWRRYFCLTSFRHPTSIQAGLLVKTKNICFSP
jgi:hypothetical protein